MSVGSLALLAAALLALPSNEVETFFLDSSGAEVGYYFRGCDGTRIRQGATTQTALTMISGCSGSGCSTISLECMLDGQRVSCSNGIFEQACHVHDVPCWGC